MRVHRSAGGEGPRPPSPLTARARARARARRLRVAQWRKSHAGLSAAAGTVTLGSLLTDYTGLTLAGVYFYLAFGLGQGLPGLLPAGLFSKQYELVHRVLAVLLLLLTLRSAILLRK